MFSAFYSFFYVHSTFLQIPVTNLGDFMLFYLILWVCVQLFYITWKLNIYGLCQNMLAFRKLWEGTFAHNLFGSIFSSHHYNIFVGLTQCLMDSACLLFSLSVSTCWSSDDPWQCSDVLKQWCMKFGQIKTFVLLHWLIIWQIGAPSCVYTVKELSVSHPSYNKEATCGKKIPL